MANRTIRINRAPMLTLWAAVVAERLGHQHDAALTYGRTVAGLNAASKARGLGIAEPEKAPKKKSPRPPGKRVEIALLGRNFDAIETEEGWRALDGGRAVSPESVERYLTAKFGDDLDAVEAAMVALARVLRAGWRPRRTGSTSDFAPRCRARFAAGAPRVSWTSGSSARWRRLRVGRRGNRAVERGVRQLAGMHVDDRVHRHRRP